MRRFHRRGGFRRKSHWIWADSFNLSLDNGLGTVVNGRRYNAALLLPPGRVKWFCDTVVRRPAVTVTGVLMWLDFFWKNTSGGAQALPDIDLFVDTTSEDDAGNITYVRDAFFEPQVPANIAAWTDVASDGLDGFLWSHHIKGFSPPNAIVRTDGLPADSSTANQSTLIHTGNSDVPAYMCRTFSVRAEWQPDVHIKTKRRLRPDEGLVIAMSGLDASFPAGVSAFLDVRTRMVAR